MQGCYQRCKSNQIGNCQKICNCLPCKSNDMSLAATQCDAVNVVNVCMSNQNVDKMAVKDILTVWLKS